MSDMYHVEGGEDVRSILMCGVVLREEEEKQTTSLKSKLFLTHFSFHYNWLCHNFPSSCRYNSPSSQ